MIETINQLIQKFHINIRQIISNSDNTIEDIKSESVLVLLEHMENINNNERIFINELKKRCLKFNKYGKRIESKERWSIYNNREENYINEVNKNDSIDEDALCLSIDIKQVIGEHNYSFLLYYYENGIRNTSKEYKISEPTIRKRVSKLIEQLRGELC